VHCNRSPNSGKIANLPRIHEIHLSSQYLFNCLVVVIGGGDFDVFLGSVMLEMFNQARWSDFYDVLSNGNPPLALQFLLINTLFFLIFAVRRARGKVSKNNNASYLVHGVLILVNAGIMFQGDLAPFYQRNILTFWNKLQHVI
jgi:hypothetical protein